MKELELFGGDVSHSGALTDTDVVRLFVRTKDNPGTRWSYENSLKKLIMHDSWKGLKKTSYRDALEYKLWLADNFGVSSQNFHLSVARGLHSFSMKLGHSTVNPFAPIPATRVQSKIHDKVLTEEEVIRLVNAPGLKERHGVFLRLAYSSGLRVAELQNLVWDDLDPDRNVLRVRRGKGGKQRFVTLPERVVEKVAGLRDPDADGADRIFPWTTANSWRVVKRAALLAGLPGDVSMHWMRHAHASHSLDRGAPLATVRDTLGHASIESTNVYLHSKPSDSSSLYLAL